MAREARLTVPWVVWSKPRLNLAKKRSFSASSPRRGLSWSRGAFSMVAHRAGVSVSATNTDSTIAVTMVIENWR